MQHFVSPSYSYEKLEAPTYDDLVDVFEDAMRNWFLVPALHLLKLPHGEVAAVALLVGYFEGIEIYCTGEDSKNQSAKFFANGFARVFAIEEDGREIAKAIAAAIYGQVRCGFAHDCMFRNRVFFNRAPSKAMLVTWPKKDGAYDHSGEIESIVINPDRFHECVLIHFDNYIAKLRSATDLKLKDAFERAMALKWALNERERFIGMTEDEFRRA
jgi:hypothetical protein